MTPLPVVTTFEGMLRVLDSRNDVDEMGHFIVEDADLSCVDLSERQLPDMLFRRVVFKEADLRGAQMQRSRFEACDLRNIKAAYLDVDRSVFVDCDFSDADMCGADFSDTELTRCKLVRSNLSEACVAKAVLRDTNLTQINLSESRASGMFVENCTATQSVMRDAHLIKTTFIGTKLTGGDFQKAVMNRVVFDKSNLCGSNFGGSIMQDAKLVSVQVADTIGLLDRDDITIITS